jgi:hypothetical protein
MVSPRKHKSLSTKGTKFTKDCCFKRCGHSRLRSIMPKWQRQMAVSTRLRQFFVALVSSWICFLRFRTLVVHAVPAPETGLNKLPVFRQVASGSCLVTGSALPLPNVFGGLKHCFCFKSGLARLLLLPSCPGSGFPEIERQPAVWPHRRLPRFQRACLCRRVGYPRLRESVP